MESPILVIMMYGVFKVLGVFEYNDHLKNGKYSFLSLKNLPKIAIEKYTIVQISTKFL